MFRFFEFITELMGWLRIIASPLLAGLIIGAIIYFNRPDTSGLIIGIIIALSGLITGIIWATRIWKKEGTIRFLSKISATPELDNKDEKKVNG